MNQPIFFDSLAQNKAQRYPYNPLVASPLIYRDADHFNITTGKVPYGNTYVENGSMYPQPLDRRSVYERLTQSADRKRPDQANILFGQTGGCISCHGSGDLLDNVFDNLLTKLVTSHPITNKLLEFTHREVTPKIREGLEGQKHIFNKYIAPFNLVNREEFNNAHDKAAKEFLGQGCQTYPYCKYSAQEKTNNKMKNAIRGRGVGIISTYDPKLGRYRRGGLYKHCKNCRGRGGQACSCPKCQQMN